MKLTRDQIEQISYYHKRGISHRKIARHFGIAYATVQHHLREIPRKKKFPPVNENICSKCKGNLEKVRVSSSWKNRYICLKCRKERQRLRRLEKKVLNAFVRSFFVN